MLPERGLPTDDVLARLDRLRTDDVRWREGRAFTLAYSAGPEVLELQAAAYAAFLGENALNTDAFPSLRTMAAEVVAITGGFLGAPPAAAGFMTSGGTESILLAVLAARERAAVDRPVRRPNMVLPTSAHAAFSKAAHYFGVEARRVPVGPDWRAEPDAMADSIDDDTVLVIASAPQYPQGVVDPVPELAALAAERGINCHVDACMGGVTLHYLARLGETVAPWHFGVDGVTSISVDLHKFGYTAKGASVLMHRTKRLRSFQTFVTDDWLGGLYGSSGIQGTKSGGSIAAAWAVMQHLGDDGYKRLTGAARTATLELVAAVDAMPDLVVRARPDAMLVAIGATDPDALDVFAVAEALWRRGWYVDRQGPPRSLHCTVNAVHEGRIAAFAADLTEAVAEVQAAGAAGAGGAYGTVE